MVRIIKPNIISYKIMMKHAAMHDAMMELYMFSSKEFYKNAVEITSTKLILLEMINKSYF